MSPGCTASKKAPKSAIPPLAGVTVRCQRSGMGTALGRGRRRTAAERSAAQQVAKARVAIDVMVRTTRCQPFLPDSPSDKRRSPPKSDSLPLASPTLTAIDNCERSYALSAYVSMGVRAPIRHSSEDDLFGKDGALLE